ncbi:MAG: flagellar basal body-associated FliL family protein [Clostridia bacterium]|nr:flagellar basal body-associated FliL family protein [Clostridia bacterium]
MSEEKSINIKLIAIIGVSVVLLSVGIAFGVAQVMLSNINTDAGKGGNAQVTTTEVGAQVDIGEFLANLSSDGDPRFIKVKIVLGLSADEEKLKKEVSEEKTSKIKDTILSILRSKTADELSQADAAENLKVQISDAVNEYLTKGRVAEVYFTSFLIQ